MISRGPATHDYAATAEKVSPPRSDGARPRRGAERTRPSSPYGTGGQRRIPKRVKQAEPTARDRDPNEARTMAPKEPFTG